ncbi:MAG: killer suppression protein [Ardenticatenaceae bacterium]
MDIIYSTKKLERTFENPRRLVRKYGKRQAKEIEKRIYDLRSADTLAKLSRVPPAGCHELTNDRAGQLSLDLKHPYRLIIEPANDPIPLREEGGLDWTQVTKVRILGVEDTHG